jgi:hypothetical protein
MTMSMLMMLMLKRSTECDAGKVQILSVPTRSRG